VCLSMKIISWNARGLGSFEKKREVRNLVREKKSIYSLYSGNKVVCV